MKHSGTIIKGYTIKDGKVKKITGYGLDASAKLRQKTSKKVRVTKEKKRWKQS